MYNIHVKYIQPTLYIPKGSQLSSLPGKHLYDCCLTCRMNAISVAVRSCQYANVSKLLQVYCRYDFACDVGVISLHGH